MIWPQVCVTIQGPKPDFAALLAQADAIERHQTDLRWIDFRRFSARQQNHMDFGGLVGNVSFWGDFTPFLPALILAAQLHIGRHTSFGFGRFRCRFEETTQPKA